MKNILFSFTVGVVVGYVLRKMDERGQLDYLCDKTSEFIDRTKKDIKNAVDTAVNEAEYISDRIEHTVD